MYKLIVIGVVVAFFLLLMVIRTMGVVSGFKKDRLRFNEYGKTSEIITEDDIEGLPKAVQRYLEYVGVVNKKRPFKMDLSISGQFKTSQKENFESVEVTQVSYFKPEVRMFLMTLKKKGLPVYGYHLYEKATAMMTIRLLDLFQVAHEAGSVMNQAETVTVFNDMCVFAPATLIDDRIQWFERSEYVVDAKFTNDGVTISATLYFNEIGQLINFESMDRYFLMTRGR